MAELNRILIVGAGIGGLTLAAALRQRGLTPFIVERAPTLAPIGAGIALWGTAMRVMRGLGLGPKLEQRGFPLMRGIIADARGRILSRSNFEGLTARYGLNVTLHRGALHETLLEAVGDTPIRLGTTVASIQPAEDQVVVKLSNGAIEAYDLVVGADGLHSSVRGMLFGEVPLRYSGYTCWRLVVDQPPDLETLIEMWGRGQRFGLVPIGGGKLYCFAVHNAPRGAPDPEEGRVERFKERFSTFTRWVPGVLEQITRPEQLIHNDLEELWVEKWHRGRVVLLGDAAHAMTPNMGQGAAMAIEDALVLTNRLLDVPDLEQALTSYGESRYKRVKWVQDQSRQIGAVGQWQSPIACGFRDFALRLVPPSAGIATLERLLKEDVK